MSATTRECSRGHGRVSGTCRGCLREWESRRPASEMAGDERVAELDSWLVVEIPFPKIHERIEELVGRPVWTHEMGSSGIERLREEARTWQHPDNLIAHVLASATKAMRHAHPGDSE